MFVDIETFLLPLQSVKYLLPRDLDGDVKIWAQPPVDWRLGVFLRREVWDGRLRGSEAGEDEGVGAVDGGRVERGEVDLGRRFVVVAHPFADDTQGDAF